MSSGLVFTALHYRGFYTVCFVLPQRVKSLCQLLTYLLFQFFSLCFVLITERDLSSLSLSLTLSQFATELCFSITL